MFSNFKIGQEVTEKLNFENALILAETEIEHSVWCHPVVLARHLNQFNLPIQKALIDSLLQSICIFLWNVFLEGCVCSHSENV